MFIQQPARGGPTGGVLGARLLVRDDSWRSDGSPRSRARGWRRRARATAMFSIMVAVWSCNATEPNRNTPVSMVALGATSVTGTAGLPVASLPTIEIRDAEGLPIAGVGFQVVVLSGGGSVTGTPSQTISGATSIGTWTLGPTVGQQQIRVQSGSLTPITITATASAAPSVAW